jgi:carbamoyl-phosphate synthase large subunit
MKKINVLFTGAGGAGTIYILRWLRQRPEYRTVAVDMNRYAAGLYLADKGYTVPSCDSPHYIETLERIISKEKIDIVVPLIDEELLKVSDFGKQAGIPVLLPEREFVAMGLDKLKTANALRKNGLGAPKTWSYEEFEMEKDKARLFPRIVKPRGSRGSRGFMVLKTLAEYEGYLATSAFEKKSLVIQEWINGTEYTVSVVVKKNGEVAAVVPKEVVVKKGITKVGITRENKAIDTLCRGIQEKLRANGPFNVQLIVSKDDGKPYVHEINPRFSTTVALTMEAGVDEIDILIKDRLGLGADEAKAFRKNLVMLRYEDQVCIDEARLETEP